MRFGVRPRPARTWITGLLIVLGAAGVATALFQVDCAGSIDLVCLRAGIAGRLSWHHYAHGWIALLTQPIPVVVSLLVARLVWPHPVAWLPIAGALFGLVFVVGGTAAAFSNPTALPQHAGVIQRTGILSLNGGVLLLAIGLMVVPRLPGLTGARPT